MKVAVACDHAGFALKETVVNQIKALGHEVVDCGCHGTESVDFPDYAAKAGAVLNSKEAERAVLICGSGIGMCIAANKIHGVYACVCHDSYSAHQGVEHDAMNALCLGASVIGKHVAEEVVERFLGAKYFDEGNYKKRVNKLLALEEKF